jgi:hypothetical protein
VRGPGETGGAFGFACPFLCYFLLGKQKKVNKSKSGALLAGLSSLFIYLNIINHAKRII